MISNNKLPYISVMFRIQSILTALIVWAFSFSTNAQTVTYLGNEGMLIEYQDSKVLIDGLFYDISGRFDSPSDEVVNGIIEGKGDYKGIQAVLITHTLPDHFDAASHVNFMLKNKTASMIATKQAADSMLVKTDSFPSIESRVTLTPWIKGWQTYQINDKITVQSAYTKHAGKAFARIQHQIFLVTIGDKKVLHVADTQMDVDYFDNLRLIYEDVDLAIVPFWFLTSLFGAEIVEKHIGATKVAGMHLPNRDNEKSLEKIKQFFPNAVVFSETGQKISF